jgi:hypothetical protein
VTGLLSISPRLPVGDFSQPLVGPNAESPNPREFACYQHTGCVSRNAKTLTLQHLQFPDIAASSGPPGKKCILHHRMIDLFVNQHTISDGQAPFPIKERAKLAQSFNCLSSYLVLVCCPDQLCL